MTLVVETGQIVANANTYASLATVTAYHTGRGNSAWLSSSEDAEPAILRAMDYLESLPWIGTPYYGPVGMGDTYQELQWPRYGAYVNGKEWAYDKVPPQVVKALCEAALIELSSPGSLAPSLERGGALKRQKIDVLEFEYFDGAPSTTQYRKVKQFLTGLLQSGNVIRLTRA